MTACVPALPVLCAGIWSVVVVGAAAQSGILYTTGAWVWRDFLATWVLTLLSRRMVTGRLRPAAWCGTTWVTCFEPAFPITERGGVQRRVRPVWKGAVHVTGADFDAVAGRLAAAGVVASRGLTITPGDRHGRSTQLLPYACGLYIRRRSCLHFPHLQPRGVSGRGLALQYALHSLHQRWCENQGGK